MSILTRSTIVQSQTRLRRERLLPQPGEVVASQGQDVKAVQVVARTRRPTQFRIVPASELWRIPTDEVAEYLIVAEGTEVQAGDVLLRKKRTLGAKTLVSPVDGTFYGLNNGRLILQQHEWFELRALVSARVVNAIPNRGIVMEVIGTQIQGVWGSGKEGSGKLKILTEAEDTPLTLTEFSEDIQNNIPVVGVIQQAEVFVSLQRRGINGLIVGSIGANLLPRAKRAPFPVVVTDGTGTQGMARNSFFLLRKHAEGEAALFAREADFWGNRPEIVIPHEITTGVLNPTQSYGPLHVGQLVKILRAPYASQVGEIVRMNDYEKLTDIGTRAIGAEVRLSDGQVVFVPYANLDTIT